MARHREMALVGFLQAQNCSNYVGSWRHPGSATDFLGVEYYQRIARTLEHGKFHLGFFDDRLAMPDILGHSHVEAVRNGVRVVKMDPCTILDLHGHGHAAPGPRLDLLDHLLRAVPRRARLRHARPDGRRPRRLERRHLAQLVGGAELRRGRAPRARPALRQGRRVHGGRARPLGQLGGRRHRRRQGDGPLRPSGEGAFAEPQRPVVPLQGAVHGAAFAAGPPGHHPGRPVRPRPGFRRALGRARVLRLFQHRDGPQGLQGVQGRGGGLRSRP